MAKPGFVTRRHLATLLVAATARPALAASASPWPIQRWATATAALVSAEVSQQFSEYEGPGTVGFRAPELAAKKELQALLRLGGALETLRGALVVLAPIIAAAISSLFE